MRMQLISAAMALGVSAVIPSAAKADRDDHRDSRVERHEREEHREFRHDRDERQFAHDREHRDFRENHREHFVPVANPDFCVAMNPSQLPQCVVETVVRQTGGCAIQSAEYLRQSGVLFYDVQVVRPYGGVELLRIGIDGCLLPR